jgi:hypothetical protein
VGDAKGECQGKEEAWGQGRKARVSEERTETNQSLSLSGRWV